MNLVRFSGIDIKQPDPLKAAFAREAVMQRVKAVAAPLLAAAREEPFCLDDAIAGMKDDDLIRSFLSAGEFFLCVDTDGSPAGFQVLYDIIPNRTCKISGFLLPFARGQGKAAEFGRQLLTYAFETLNLIKVRAEIGEHNYPAAALAMTLGGCVLATIPLDNLFKGQPSGTLLVEFYNPAIVAPPEIINVKPTRDSGDSAGTELHPTGSLYAGDSECAGGDESDAIGELGDGGDESITSTPAIDGEQPGFWTGRGEQIPTDDI